MCTHCIERHRKSLILKYFGYIKENENTKNGQFGEFLKSETCGQTVLPDQFNRTKIGGKCQNETFWIIFKQCV